MIRNFQNHFYTLLILSTVFVGFQANAQTKLEIGTVIQENKITDFSNQKLILIDFWATWCVPCLPAARQLEVYQEQLKDEVYMIGISDENEFKIRRFVDEQDLRLAIYQDHNDFNVRHFDVPYRPYSVVLNAQGKVVWKGSPSALSVHKLRTLVQKESFQPYQLEDLFQFTAPVFETFQYTEIDTAAIFAKTSQKEIIQNQFIKTESRVYFEGDLIQLYSKLLGLPKTNFESALDIKVVFGAKANLWDFDKDRIMQYLSDQFQVKLDRKRKRVISQEVKITDPSLLWDTHQIDWGNEGINTYMIGEQRLEADGMTVSEICNLLSELKNKPFIYKGKDDLKHDWSFHYNYDNLMEEELRDQFGIEILPGVPTEVEMITIKNSNS
ncbi:MAG: redoxin domain-containing protein [Saprospiraceae bacterium]|nr:redoxin domain-containing protein [Saprospiraceae bacterium]